MPNLLESLSGALDGGGFNASLAGEVSKLVEIAQQAAALKENPDGIAGFVGSLAALVAPAMPNGGDVLGGLSRAQAAIPNVTGGAAPDALADLARFGTLVSEQLVPVLARSVEAAKAIEGIAKAQFRCPPGPPPPGLLTPPAPPPEPSGQTRAAAAQARSDGVAARMDELPSPLTPAALLDHLIGLAAGPQRSEFLPFSLPVVDDILLPLQSLGRWSLATPSQVGDELAVTLAVLRDRLTAATSTLIDARLAPATALSVPLRAAELTTFAQDYVTQATSVAAALDAADQAAAATAAGQLNATITAFEAVRTAQAADFTPQVAALSANLSGLGAAIHDRLLHLVVQLEPFDASIFTAAASPQPAADAAAEQALRDTLAPILNFIEDLGEKLDLSAIEGGVTAIATEAQGIADQITAGLATVAQESRAAFAAVEAEIAALPIDALATEMRAAIQQAGATLRNAISRAFDPLRDALTAAIGAVSDALDGLDPQAVADALTDAVAQITGILQDPAVLSAVEEVRNGLDQAATAAGSLSFAPVTDEVIKLIEAMTDGLKALDSAELNDALVGMLSTAMAVLPPDLRPVTQPLIDDLGVRIDQGPVALLEDIRARPQEVVDRIRSFDPGKLAGEVLGQPFNQALGALQSVQPSALIGQLESHLAVEKVRLKAIASPSKALKQVSDAFDSLLDEFDKLSPDALLHPIEAAVEQAIQDVVDASPVDEIFAEIDAVFDTIQAVLDTLNSIATTMDRVADALQALRDPDSAIDAWRDAALDKIAAAPNGAALETLLAEISAAVDSATRQALFDRLDAGTAALTAALSGIDAESALARMVALHQRLRPLVRALPAGADRTAIEAALARFDPLDPAQAGGLRAASVLQEALRDARAGIDTQASEFADLLHGPDGALTQIRDAATDTTLLRAAVDAEVEKALPPVRFLIARLGGAAVPIGVIAAGVAEMQTRLTGSLGDILTGPTSLQSVSDAMQQVVDAIRNIDLGFLREALEGVFQSVRAEIEAAGPKPVIIALEQEFGAVIDALSLSAILPASEIAALDQAITDVVAKLRGFDPEILVGNAVGPAFEADVLPLVEALDITPVFDKLIEALRGLEEQLNGEMGRINTSYGALLAARPAGGGSAVSFGT